MKRHTPTAADIETEGHYGLHVWFLFYLIIGGIAVYNWFRYRHVCTEHKPKPLRVKGSPWAKEILPSICDACFDSRARDVDRKV